MAREYVHRLRPKRKTHGGEKHGVYCLAEMLKGSLDGRLKLKKERDRMEADLVDHCGGLQALSPPMLSLITDFHTDLAALIRGEFCVT